jgi:hypothetical protein
MNVAQRISELLSDCEVSDTVACAKLQMQNLLDIAETTQKKEQSQREWAEYATTTLKNRSAR